MYILTEVNMLLWFFYLGTVLSSPADEFSDREFSYVEFQKQIVPSGWSLPKLFSDRTTTPSPYNLVDEAHRYKLKLFNKNVRKGYASKKLTFNMYDDNMRETTILLFRLLQNIDDCEQRKSVTDWLIPLINLDMLEYVYRLLWLFTNQCNTTGTPLRARMKPNYFVNIETIVKAYQMRNDIVGSANFGEDALTNEIKFTSNGFLINSNYSGWNLKENGCEEELNYFREDVGLNSYYYGLSLMHPFWMSNDELDEIYPRHAEHYYFSHQQLMARYQLEKEHLKQKNTLAEGKCRSSYNPYLIYKNGLPFPVRQPPKEEWNKERSKLTSIDIAIKECISRGLIVLDNGTIINMTDDNHVNVLAKLIRVNLDGIESGKIVRSFYGGNYSGYNPAPSVLHNAETSLRDPLYWTLIQTILNYFIEYKNNMEPYNFSKYQSEDIYIIDSNFTEITTQFENFNLKLNNIFDYGTIDVTARQRRLSYLPFTLNFTVESKVERDVKVKLFLGPQCSANDCWQRYSNFYQLDNYRHILKEGLNIISWSPKLISTRSKECYDHEESRRNNKNMDSSYAFPENLIIPRGLEDGLNLTLFIIITPTEEKSNNESLKSKVSYCKLGIFDMDYPIGAPFHRQAAFDRNYNSNNYKFYNISIYHKLNSLEDIGYFSPHLH